MVDGIEKLPRGIRNMNPGNIKLGTDWDGLADEQSDPTFCVFKETVWGIRALMRILLVYRFSHKKYNVDDIISRWACLLYTSPSPRDRTRSRMPSSA